MPDRIRYKNPGNPPGLLAGLFRESALLMADRGLSLRLLGIAARLDDLAADLASIDESFVRAGRFEKSIGNISLRQPIH